MMTILLVKMKNEEDEDKDADDDENDKPVPALKEDWTLVCHWKERGGITLKVSRNSKTLLSAYSLLKQEQLQLAQASFRDKQRPQKTHHSHMFYIVLSIVFKVMCSIQSKQNSNQGVNVSVKIHQVRACLCSLPLESSWRQSWRPWNVRLTPMKACRTHAFFPRMTMTFSTNRCHASGPSTVNFSSSCQLFLWSAPSMRTNLRRHTPGLAYPLAKYHSTYFYIYIYTCIYTQIMHNIA